MLYNTFNTLFNLVFVEITFRVTRLHHGVFLASHLASTDNLIKETEHNKCEVSLIQIQYTRKKLKRNLG